MEKNKQISHLQHSHDIRRYFVAYCVVPAGCAPVENDDVTRCAWLLNAPAHLSTLGGFLSSTRPHVVTSPDVGQIPPPTRHRLARQTFGRQAMTDSRQRRPFLTDSCTLLIRQWDVSYTSIVLWIGTIRKPCTQGCGPPDVADVCCGMRHFNIMLMKLEIRQQQRCIQFTLRIQ